MIKSSQVAAEMALADGSQFVLPAGKWREFYAALDAPPRATPGLRKLFPNALNRSQAGWLVESANPVPRAPK